MKCKCTVPRNVAGDTNGFGNDDDDDDDDDDNDDDDDRR